MALRHDFRLASATTLSTPQPDRPTNPGAMYGLRLAPPFMCFLISHFQVPTKLGRALLPHNKSTARHRYVVWNSAISMRGQRQRSRKKSCPDAWNKQTSVSAHWLVV